MCLLKGAAPVTAFLPLFWECTCYSASGFYWGTLHKYPILHKQGVCHPQPSTHPERDRQTEPEQESETDEICVSVCVCAAASLTPSLIECSSYRPSLSIFHVLPDWIHRQSVSLKASPSPALICKLFGAPGPIHQGPSMTCVVFNCTFGKFWI